MTAEGTLEFRLLGPLEARLDDRPLPLGGIRQRGLLALLLLRANEVVARDRLIDELWRDHAPESAANALAALVARLRRALPPDVLVTRSGGYEARVDPAAVDLHRFERLVEEGSHSLAAGDEADAAARLRTALALWRGPPLADFTYEPFAEATIRRLEELRLTALENRIDADLALGRHAQLVGELQALVREQPLRERLRGQLMLALYRSGRQAEALEAYRDGRRTLLDELGIDPSPALQELEQAILRQDARVEAPAKLRAGQTAPPGAAPPADEARPATLLAADLVGAKALGERLSPEEADALVGESMAMMRLAVEEYGGTVQAVQGDGIAASFGVPDRHENDPERAARAALRILERVDEYANDVESAWGITAFAARIGIVNGAVDGDAARIAERVQAAADPGTILVGGAAVRRLSHRFTLEPHGEVELEEPHAPLAVSRLVRRPPDDAERPTAPHVGRERELGLLRAVVADVVAGRGRIVVLSGPAGIGKSRLVSELRSLAADEATWLEGHCLSYGGLAAWPFIEMLLGWLAAEIGEPEIAVRTKARARLGALLGERLDEVLAPLGRFLRLRPEAGSTAAEKDPQQAYVEWLEALAAEEPVIVVVEDVQWADSATRKLAEAVTALTDLAGVALVVTDEPIAGSEGAALRTRATRDYAHRTAEIALGPLDEEAASALLDAALGEVGDQGDRDRLLAEAEGNPLYLEELARAFQEGALDDRGRTWTISLRSPELLPPTLENLLIARVDRLAAGPRRLAQTAAAIGRTYPVDVLERVSGEPVSEDLAALFRTEIAREVRRYPEFECEFTHGLLQEVALGTLTAPARRELYGRIAAAYEEVYAGSLDEHAERLAHYHAQAGNLPKALEYAERARR
jgi:DNA-binding SARP family transcriptional activator